MKLFLLMIHLFYMNVSFCQKNDFKAFVADAFSKKKIEYAKISISSVRIAFTNSEGEFSVVGNYNISDTLFVEAIGYDTKIITIRELIINPKIYLTAIEQIQPIVVKQKKVKTHLRKIRDFTKPRFFPFPNCSHSVRSLDARMSFLPNQHSQLGFIEKVHIQMVSNRNTYQVDPVTNKKIYTKNPEWIKIRIRCFKVNAENEPDTDIIVENMIFLIKSYKSQWLDISNFNVPFPQNGAFIGFEVIEVKERENWGLGTVSFPVFKENNGGTKILDYTLSVEYKNPYKKGFFNIGAEVSFENK